MTPKVSPEFAVTVIPPERTTRVIRKIPYSPDTLMLKVTVSPLLV